MISQHRAFLAVVVIGALAVPAQAAHRRQSQDDSDLQIFQTSPANFPPSLASAGIKEGVVRAVISIDADGKFTDCLITGYTHPAFVNEVLSSLRAWEFKAARQHGEPVGTRAELEFLFEAKGAVISLTSGEALSARMNTLFGEAPVSLVCKFSELDEPLTTVALVNPRPPQKPSDSTRSDGTVLIDFFVDGEGHPRMPVVIRSTDEMLASAAVGALSLWRFKPPTRDGRPVAVRVQQEFRFPAEG